MLIMILFHNSDYRCLKHMHRTFPKVGTYYRFVELGNKMAILSALFTTNIPLGKLKFRRQRSFTDMQKNQRIFIKRKGIAQRGKCSRNRFFRSRLHLIHNKRGELLNSMHTPGDINKCEPFEYNYCILLIPKEAVCQC